MTARTAIMRFLAQEDLNFLLTNRIPRYALTRFMGWFSKLEHPLVRVPSIALWRFFCDIDSTDWPEMRFRSLHAAFTRPLKPGSRPLAAEPDVLVSPSDGIVGACGRIVDGQAFQIKGSPYALTDLLGDEATARQFADGWFITLRLTAGMYHRFHAPHDLEVEQVRYIAGDTWNVNPIALKRIERLFCKNERAPITVRLLASEARLVLVPVAAILVASIRLPFLDEAEGVRAMGEGVRPCSARFTKGEEMGWFEHGSTIVIIAPPGCEPLPLTEGQHVRMGEALLRLIAR